MMGLYDVSAKNGGNLWRSKDPWGLVEKYGTPTTKQSKDTCSLVEGHLPKHLSLSLSRAT